MKKVLLINKGNADNLGDQAIKFVLSKMLIESGYKVIFRDFTFDIDSPNRDFMKSAQSELEKDSNTFFLRTFHRNMLKYSLYKNFIWNLAERNNPNDQELQGKFDAIIIGGGQLIMSNSVFSSAMRKWLIYFDKHHFEAERYIFGVGVAGPFKGLEHRTYKKYLNKFNSIFIRDYNSIDTLKHELGVNSNYVPDVVFNISNIFKVEQERKNRVLIGITDYLVYERYNGNHLTKMEYYNTWLDKVKYYVDRGDEVVLFYTTTRDLSETINFSKYLSKYNINLVISNITNLEDLIILIASSSVIVSGRMHALIIGFSYKCMVIPFIISDKIKTFNEEYVVQKPSLESIQSKIIKSFNEIV